MNTIAVWLLIAATPSNNASPTVIAKFATQQACESVVVQMETKADNKRGMSYLRGICVQGAIVVSKGESQ